MSQRRQELVLAAVGLPQLIDQVQPLLRDGQALAHLPLELSLTLFDPPPGFVKSFAKQKWKWQCR